MQFVSPISWDDALELIGDKSPIGAALSSSEWSDVPEALRRRAMFSANVENVRFLQRAQDSLGDFLASNKTDTPNGPMLATGGRAAFIQQLREFAQAEGMGPLDPEDAGGLKDITSERRLGLIFDTLTTQAGSYAYWRQGQDRDVLNEFPGMRFIRVVEVKEPRLSHEQFENQIYLKNDPIWSTRINQDFNVPWAPFGWGCGHDVEDADRGECVEAGVMDENQQFEPDVKNFNENLQASALNLPAELLQKLEQVFGRKIEIANDVIRWVPQEEEVPSSTFKVPSQKPAGGTPALPGANQSPVSAALDIQARGSLRESVKTALSAIDKVHDDGALPNIPLDDQAGHSWGAFAVSRASGSAVKISINPNGPWPALTAVHESGHFLDLEAIGAKGGMATRAGDALIQPVIDAAEQTDRIQELRAALANSTSWRYREQLQYLLDPAEVWARAYAQYIAQKSGNATLLRDLANLRNDEPVKAWSDADFQPIADAIETMFETLGWI